MLPRPSKLQEAVGLRITVGALILLVTPALSLASGSRSKKVIYYGWGLPDTQYVRDHWREMEEMPFDGLGIVVAADRELWQKGRKGTPNQLGWQVMGERRFRLEDFCEAIADLKSARWRSFTDNFLPVILSTSISTSGLNWFDDERWQIIASNFAVVAKIAAEGGMKGLILDPEHYGCALFTYAEQRKRVDRPFEEYVAVARKRGRAIMKAIASQKPDAILLSFYAYSLVAVEMEGRKNMATIQYSLLSAFYDGMLEAMHHRAQLVDGFEFSYGYKARDRFIDAYARIHGSAALFSAVPKLYRTRVNAGFGLRIDNKDGFDYFKPEEFREALRYALEVSDKYVWIYGQSPRFFPPSGIPFSYIDAIGAARPRALINAREYYQQKDTRCVLSGIQRPPSSHGRHTGARH